MAGFRAAASARYPPTLVAGLLPHHCPATRVISSLHLPPAGYLCFARSCIVPRRGCGAASSPRVPPLRTPAEESLGRFNDSRRTRRRLHASLPAAVAVAVACALGAACLLRVAVFVAPLSLSRLARRRSITKADASGGDKLDPDHGSAKDGGSRGVSNEGPDARTPIMLGTILLGKHTDSAKIHLVHHVFTAVLRPNDQLQLLECVYQLAFPENHEITQKTEVFPKDLLGGEKNFNAGLAMAQIYMEMHKYKDAQQVLERLSESITPSSLDKRLDLLKAANNVMLAVDLLRSKGDTLTKEMFDELFELIVTFKTCRDEYRKGLASTTPDVNDN